MQVKGKMREKCSGQQEQGWRKGKTETMATTERQRTGRNEKKWEETEWKENKN